MTFMLWNGTDVHDLANRLTLSANGMGTVKLHEPGELDDATLGAWLDQAKSAADKVADG